MAVYNGKIDNEARGCIAKIRNSAMRSGFAPADVSKITLELPAKIFDQWIPPDGDFVVFAHVCGIKVRRLSE